MYILIQVFFCKDTFSFSWKKYVGVALLGHKVGVCLVL